MHYDKNRNNAEKYICDEDEVAEAARKIRQELQGVQTVNSRGELSCNPSFAFVVESHLKGIEEIMLEMMRKEQVGKSRD